MKKRNRYSPEVRERAVRMVREHESEYDSQWAAIRSIAEKIGCTAETLRKWVHFAVALVGSSMGLDQAAEQSREHHDPVHERSRALLVRQSTEIVPTAASMME